jgi:hypothetical protein
MHYPVLFSDQKLLLNINHESITVIPESITVANESITVANESITLIPESNTVTYESVTVRHESITVTYESITVIPESNTVTPESITVTPKSSTVARESRRRLECYRSSSFACLPSQQFMVAHLARLLFDVVFILPSTQNPEKSLPEISVHPRIHERIETAVGKSQQLHNRVKSAFLVSKRTLKILRVHFL